MTLLCVRVFICFHFFRAILQLLMVSVARITIERFECGCVTSVHLSSWKMNLIDKNTFCIVFMCTSGAKFYCVRNTYALNINVHPRWSVRWLYALWWDRINVLERRQWLGDSNEFMFDERGRIEAQHTKDISRLPHDRKDLRRWPNGAVKL